MLSSAPSPAIDPPAPPWQRPDFLGRAPTDGYGYLGENALRPCTLEELRQVVGRGGEQRVHFVWGPGAGRCVPTAELPEVFEAFRGAEVARASQALREKGMWALLVGAGVFLFGQRLLGLPLSWLIMLWAAFFLLPMLDIFLRKREWSRATAAQAPAFGEASRFLHWLAWQPTTRTTHALIGALVVTWLLSETMGSASARRLFAMDEAGVRAGAWWKPLTCFFLHAGVIHLVFNSLALSRLGQWVEVLTNAAWVPFILLFSTLGGSLFGFLLPPDVPSVGASGGVLGLLGFLLVFARAPGRAMPAAFQRQLWHWVGAITLLGLIGWNVIDNAAHLGGLLTGAALGAATNALQPPRVPPQPAPRLAPFGWLAAGVLALTAAWMSWIFWQSNRSRSPARGKAVIVTQVEWPNRLQDELTTQNHKSTTCAHHTQGRAS